MNTEKTKGIGPLQSQYPLKTTNEERPNPVSHPGPSLLDINAEGYRTLGEILDDIYFAKELRESVGREERRNERREWEDI